MTPDVLHSYLQQLGSDGWLPPKPKGEYWQTGYRQHSVDVCRTRNWVSVRTNIREIENDIEALEWNSRVFLAKLSRDRTGCMILSADWPADDLNFSSVRLLMTATARALATTERASANRSIVDSRDSTVERLALYIPKERIWQYLRQIDRSGWYLAGEPENSRWQFHYHGHIGKFYVRMEFTEHWTHFQARLPIWLGEHNHPSLAHLPLYRQLLALNGTMRMARFRLAENGVVLSLHCPTERLNFGMFEICMQSMAVYLDRMGPEVILLASSERLGHFIHSGVLPPAEDFLWEA